jgi:hypothetical protein
MSRMTGSFQQKELREKLRRLEQEIARAKAAAEELSRKAEARLTDTRSRLAEAASRPSSAGSAAPAERGTLASGEGAERETPKKA